MTAKEKMSSWEGGQSQIVLGRIVELRWLRTNPTTSRWVPDLELEESVL